MFYSYCYDLSFRHIIVLFVIVILIIIIIIVIDFLLAVQYRCWKILLNTESSTVMCLFQ